MSNLYREPSIDASYQVSIYLAERFRRRRFKVVCRPLTFHIFIFSSETSQPNELKLGRKHLWMVLSKDFSFHPDPLTIMAATGNSCFWLADFFKSSPPKLLGQINRNLVGSIYWPIRTKNCLWRPCLLTDREEMSNLYREPSIDASYQVSIYLAKQFRRRRFTETAWTNEPKLGRKHVWKVLYKDCSFHPDPLTNMAATGNSCFWLVHS
jgi:membrane protein YqaA with SNARE-associated domain